MKELL